MDVARLFSQADLERVRQAAVAAEGHTSGEIVPYVVGRCDGYEGARWKAAALGALLAAASAAVVFQLAGVWGGSPLWWGLLPVAGGAAAGYLAASLSPALSRRLVPAAVIDHRVHQRAAVAFVDEEVFATRDRTGILLFVAVFERRVVVLGDSGIHAKVEPGTWDGIVAGIVAGLAAGRPAEALIEAIGECGRLLERHGVARAADDVNELPDELRLRED